MAVRPFIDTMRELRSGLTHDELSESLNEVVAAVRLTGKPGELTLKLKIKPFSKGNVETLNIEDEIISKVPELDRGGTVFFATVENNLTRNNPASPENTPLRDVSPDADTDVTRLREVAM